MIKPKVLFLCSDNSCRTQMAEAFLRDVAGDRFEAVSAGSEATALDPDAVAVMQEVGLDISGQTPKKVDLFMRERIAFLVTLYERETERTCPIFPAQRGVLNGRLKTRQPRKAGMKTGRVYAVPATKSGSMSRSLFRNMHNERNQLWKSGK